MCIVEDGRIDTEMRDLEMEIQCKMRVKSRVLKEETCGHFWVMLQCRVRDHRIERVSIVMSSKDRSCL